MTPSIPGTRPNSPARTHLEMPPDETSLEQRVHNHGVSQLGSSAETFWIITFEKNNLIAQHGKYTAHICNGQVLSQEEMIPDSITDILKQIALNFFTQTLQFKEGTYVGGIVEGKAGGIGRWNFPNGDFSVGHFEKDCYKQVFMRTTNPNNIYEGEIVNDKIHGQGRAYLNPRFEMGFFEENQFRKGFISGIRSDGTKENSIIKNCMVTERGSARMETAKRDSLKKALY